MLVAKMVFIFWEVVEIVDLFLGNLIKKLLTFSWEIIEAHCTSTRLRRSSKGGKTGEQDDKPKNKISMLKIDPTFHICQQSA